MNLLGRLVMSLLGMSAYAPAPSNLPSLSDPKIEAAREKVGGQLTQNPTTRLRWYLSDLESAMGAADSGDLSMAAQLSAACRRDGVFAGVLSTRTNGIVGLPKRFSGRADIVAALEGRDGVCSVFDHMCPPAELAMLAGDGIMIGVAVGELVPVEGRNYPVLRRLEPEFLRYRWQENRWYYSSIVGLLPITPGDGRWVLHIDGGYVSPWRAGLWHAVGQAWIDKQHARMAKANWEAKLANPARVATSPQGATDEQEQTWFQAVMAWGYDTVFGMKPGYDVKLLESNGVGWQSFQKTIDQAANEYMIAVAGQTVTTDGGTGFANADVHKSIRADLIKSTADNLAFTINTQVVPPYVATTFGEDALRTTGILEWDTKPPKDMKSDADVITAYGAAIEAANQALAAYGRRVDAVEMATQFGVTLEPLEEPEDAEEDGAVDVDFTEDDANDNGDEEDELAA